MIWFKKSHKNLEFFQNALTFLFLRVKHSDSERFPIRSQTLVSEHFHAYFRSETVNVEGSIIILQLRLQKAWFDWYADFVLNLSWCFRLDSRWLNFNDLPLVTNIFVLHPNFVPLCSEMYVSDLIRNLSKYEKITLKNTKVRAFYSRWFVLDYFEKSWSPQIRSWFLPLILSLVTHLIWFGKQL